MTDKKLAPIDKLEEIFKMQLELNNFTLQNNGYNLTMESISKDKVSQNVWLSNYAKAMSQEIAELNDSTNWKWWRTKVDLFDPQNAAVELIDILHFWVSACQALGLSACDVFQIYAQKNAINIQRQQNGYLIKDENDCKNIKPKEKK